MMVHSKTELSVEEKGVIIVAKIIECIPNFSLSKERDPEKFQELVDLASGIPGCSLFDVQSDGNHNRTVFTMLGSPEGIAEAAFALTKKAAELIEDEDFEKALGYYSEGAPHDSGLLFLSTKHTKYTKRTVIIPVSQNALKSR